MTDFILHEGTLSCEASLQVSMKISRCIKILKVLKMDYLQESITIKIYKNTTGLKISLNYTRLKIKILH